MRHPIRISIVLSFAVLLVLASCSGNDRGRGILKPDGQRTDAAVLDDNRPLTTIQWIDSAKNIGRISEGEKVEITYRFRNTGKQPLVITSVAPSCGCTVAEKPEQPVLPGEQGMIKASFNSLGRVGTNHKTLTVYANIPDASYLLTFEVEVLKSE
jgi:hypothetical protein